MLQTFKLVLFTLLICHELHWSNQLSLAFSSKKVEVLVQSYLVATDAVLESSIFDKNVVKRNICGRIMTAEGLFSLLNVWLWYNSWFLLMYSCRLTNLFIFIFFAAKSEGPWLSCSQFWNAIQLITMQNEVPHSSL